jgi:hypothetical protein
MNEREREKKAAESAIQGALDGGKALADISSEERFYNRSVKIRRNVMRFLMEHVGIPYDSLGDLEAQAANFSNCSMVTARRWLFQWTRDDKPFYIEEKTNYYIIRERPAKS